MDFNFSIHFGYDTTADYETAVELAKRFDRFIPVSYDSSRNVIHTGNHEVLAKYHNFQKLMETIRDWNSAGVTVGDEEIPLAAFYQGKDGISDCYRRYLAEQNQEEYCNDGSSDCWGCKHLKGIILRHEDAPYDAHAKYWYQFGEFTNKTTWHIHKEKLIKTMTETVERKSIDFCPAFHYKFIRKLVAAMPASIDVTDTQNWGPTYLDDAIQNTTHWEAVGIFHKTSTLVQDKVDIVTEEELKAAQEAHRLAKERKLEANIHLRNIPETSFADIGGIDDIIQSIRSVIELPIKKPELYEYLGIKPYRGILLWGEPGNGKTLIAKAIAHEVDAHFVPIVGPDILNKGFGESERNMRAIFEEAGDMQPSVIFIDEIDSIAQTRLAGESNKWYATVVNQLMTLMDGIKDFGNITVLASTNRPDLLDAALLRPGRFDYKLEVRKPNLPGCKKVLEIATREMPLADDVDLFYLAEAVMGYSAAEITFVVKEAAMVAVRRSVDINLCIKSNDPILEMQHIEVNHADFMNALHTLKWNRRYVNLTYSLK